MSVLKKLLPLLILLLFVYAWYLLFYSRSHPQNISTIPQPTQNYLRLIVEPEEGVNPILEEIKSAQKEIDLEVYLLSDKSVIQALEEADARGVDVNVMLEEHPFGGGGLNPKIKKDLEDHGVDVLWSSPNYPLTHEKSMIIDNTKVLIMTQNLTTTSFTKNREYDILDLNKADIAEVKNIFTSDWNRSSFYPSITNLVISPNTSRNILSSLVDGCKRKVDIEVEVISDISFTNLLLQKANTCQINLLIPPLKTLTSNQKDVNILQKGNVHVKTLSTPYLHAKLIIQDNLKAYIGSVNFSTQSLDENRELGIIISQPDILNRLESTFEKDWQKGVTLTP